MYDISECCEQIESLRQQIYKLIDKDVIKYTQEILKLSGELDLLLNIWYKIYYRERTAYWYKNNSTLKYQ